MAIEALGGVMSYQAQPTVKPQTTVTQSAVSMEGTVIESAPMVDAATPAVAAVSEQGDNYQAAEQQMQQMCIMELSQVWVTLTGICRAEYFIKEIPP